MKGPAPEPTGIDWQKVGHSVEHLAGGFVREGQQEDVARIDPILQKVSDTISKGARLCPSQPRQ